MKRIISQCALVAGVLTLSACGGSGSAPPPIASALDTQEEVSFDLDLSGLFAKEATPDLFEDFTVKADSNLMTGTMLVENLDSAETDTYSWTVNLDEDDLSNVQSLKTLVLEPANYNFSLVLNRDDHQYVGTAVHTVDDGEAELVPMTVRPVFGDTQVDTNVVANLVDFKFSFPQSDVNGLFSPAIGISIDGNPEQIFTLDPATGLSEHMFLNLLPGTYDFALRLFDGGTQVGKSLAGQGSTITVAQGVDVNLDIVPLYGEVGLALAVDGGDAIFSIRVPAEVVNEAGGLAELEAVFSVVGPENPLQERLLALSPDGVDYIADVTLSEMRFGNLDFELVFKDLSDNEILGSCVDNGSISSTPASVNCNLTLRRRSVVSGNILSTIGINVVDINGESIPGAVISVDGNDVAITNSAVFSTPGYSKLYLTPGSHDIRAQSGSVYGELIHTALPLAVQNLDLILDQSEAAGVFLLDDFTGVQTGSLAPTSYWFGCLAKGNYQGYIGAGSIFLGSRYNNTRSDWCWGTSALTQHSFTDAAITDAGGFSVSVDVNSAAAPNSVASIAIGGEIGADPYAYYSHLTSDALVNVRDNNVQITLYNSGTVEGDINHTIPYLMSEINNITLNVVTDSFALDAAATIEVVINNDTSLVLPAAGFAWDGGNNHIELKGSAGVGTNGGGTNYIEYGQLAVSPIQ